MEIIREQEIPVEDRKGYLVRKLLSGTFGDAPKSLAVYNTRVAAGGVCKKQWHNQSYEMVYFLTKGSAWLEGKVYQFEKGDLVFLSPTEKHEWRASEGDLELFAIRYPDLPQDKFTE